jgi:hypothetical protein
MPKHPVLNAFLAGAYILTLVLVMSNVMEKRIDDTLVIPMVMMSLFTLSAAVMGYLFLADPIMLYLDGKKKEAVSFFLRTMGSFAVITAIFMLAFVSGFGG